MLTKQEESIFRSKLGLTIMKYFGISFVIALASGVATTLLLNCFIRENGISGGAFVLHGDHRGAFRRVFKAVS